MFITFLIVFLMFTNTYINMSIKKGHHFSWLRSKIFFHFDCKHCTSFLSCNPDFWNSDSTSWVQENYICCINSLWTIFWGIYEAQKLSTLLLVDTSANMGFLITVNNILSLELANHKSSLLHRIGSFPSKKGSRRIKFTPFSGANSSNFS